MASGTQHEYTTQQPPAPQDPPPNFFQRNKIKFMVGGVLLALGGYWHTNYNNGLLIQAEKDTFLRLAPEQYRKFALGVKIPDGDNRANYDLTFPGSTAKVTIRPLGDVDKKSIGKQLQQLKKGEARCAFVEYHSVKFAHETPRDTIFGNLAFGVCDVVGQDGKLERFLVNGQRVLTEGNFQRLFNETQGWNYQRDRTRYADINPPGSYVYQNGYLSDKVPSRPAIGPVSGDAYSPK